jgi:hypothetical protein
VNLFAMSGRSEVLPTNGTRKGYVTGVALPVDAGFINKRKHSRRELR